MKRWLLQGFQTKNPSIYDERLLIRLFIQNSKHQQINLKKKKLLEQLVSYKCWVSDLSNYNCMSQIGKNLHCIMVIWISFKENKFIRTGTLYVRCTCNRLVRVPFNFKNCNEAGKAFAVEYKMEKVIISWCLSCLYMN